MARRPTTARKTSAKGSPGHLQQGNLLEALERSPDARDTVRAMLLLGKQKEHWRGFIATPPGSLLETVLAGFRAGTDIPLEIPFFATLHFLAGYLLQQGVSVGFAGQRLRPDLWSVILAASGAGKTYATSAIGKMTGVTDGFPEPASAAKFVADLAEHNNELWIRDEFAHFLKALEQQSHMAEIKDYLLRVYDGKAIERRTKKETILVEHPALCILGLTVLETFRANVTTESMLDGFAQRFSYILAQRDPARPSKDFPIYDLRASSDRITAEWHATIRTITHAEYEVTEGGEAGFRESFALLYPTNEEIPASFFRRIMFRGVRYALLYHILLGKTSNLIDAADMGWAARVCAMHVQDAAWLVGEHALPDLERMMRRAEEVRDELAAQGVKLTPRDLIRRMNGIRTASEARALISLLEGT